MKALRLVGNRIVTHGDPPYDGFFTLEMADALMKDNADRAIDILMNLSPRSASQLMTMIRLDSKLQEKYNDLIEHSRAKAPRKNTSVPFDIDDILDEVFVFQPPIASLLFLIDGRRFVREDPDNMTLVLTFEEYEEKFGESVPLALERIRTMKEAIFDRAVYLANAKPHDLTVSFANRDTVFEKKIIAYDREQVAAFATRKNSTVLGIEEESTAK